MQLNLKHEAGITQRLTQTSMAKPKQPGGGTNAQLNLPSHRQRFFCWQAILVFSFSMFNSSVVQNSHPEMYPNKTLVVLDRHWNHTTIS